MNEKPLELGAIVPGDEHVPDGDVTWRALTCRCGHMADVHQRVPSLTPARCFGCGCLDFNYKPEHQPVELRKARPAVAEKLYRIKPLVFVRRRAKAAIGPDYYIDKIGRFYFGPMDKNFGWSSIRLAVVACQRDYEARLIASSVIETCGEPPMTEETPTERKLRTIAKRKISIAAKLREAYSAGYGEAFEDQMRIRVRDAQDRRRVRPTFAKAL